MLEYLKTDSFKRLAVTLLAPLFVFINKKFGWDIPTEQVVIAIAALATLVATSNFRAGKEVQAEAHVEAAKLVAGAASVPTKP